MDMHATQLTNTPRSRDGLPFCRRLRLWLHDNNNRCGLEIQTNPAALPQVEIQLLDADRLCEKELALFLDAPEPFSSSEPFDVMP